RRLRLARHPPAVAVVRTLLPATIVVPIGVKDAGIRRHPGGQHGARHRRGDDQGGTVTTPLFHAGRFSLRPRRFCCTLPPATRTCIPGRRRRAIDQRGSLLIFAPSSETSAIRPRSPNT